MRTGGKMSEAEKKEILDLHHKGCTGEEIAEVMGRNQGTISRFLSLVKDGPAPLQPPAVSAPRNQPPIPPDADPKTLPKDAFDKFKLQLASRSISSAAALVDSIERMSHAELRKLPLSQRAVAAGILIDKFNLLTQPPPVDALSQVTSLFSLIAQSIPPRAKDALPTATVIPAGDAEPIDVDPVTNDD